MLELTPERVVPALSTARYGRSLRSLASTGSTNDDARADGAAGAVRGHVVLADVQTRGRGSNGRSWESPAGLDLYLSIVDRPPLTLPQLPPLTLAAGSGCARGRTLARAAHVVSEVADDGCSRQSAPYPGRGDDPGYAVELIVIGSA